jgi:hypothetical protein
MRHPSRLPAARLGLTEGGRGLEWSGLGKVPREMRGGRRGSLGYKKGQGPFGNTMVNSAKSKDYYVTLMILFVLPFQPS